MKQDKKIGNYIFAEKNIIGNGTYGSVYLGQDQTNSQKVAIKVLSKEIIDKDYYLKRTLSNEVEIMKKLNSPYTVKFIDAKESPKNYYIIQEYCEDGDLNKQIKNSFAGLPEKDALMILIDILKGFLVLLKNGIIHRDLKPANILKNKNSLLQKYKIGDFGFAKQLFSYSMNQMLSSSVGTPIYMCPQILSKQKYTNKCDIWSIGIIYYELLYKTYPWIGMNRQILLDNLLSQQLSFPNDSDVSDLSKDFITQCLQISEKKRFSWTDIYQHPLVRKHFVSDLPINPQEEMIKNIIERINHRVVSDKISIPQVLDKCNMTEKQWIEEQEFHLFIKSLNKDISLQEVTLIYEHIKEQNKKKLSLSDLYIWLKSQNVCLYYYETLSPTLPSRKISVQDYVKKESEQIIRQIQQQMIQRKINFDDIKRKFSYSDDKILNDEEFSSFIKAIYPRITQNEMHWLSIYFDSCQNGLICIREITNKFQQLQIQTKKPFNKKIQTKSEKDAQFLRLKLEIEIENVINLNFQMLIQYDVPTDRFQVECIQESIRGPGYLLQKLHKKSFNEKLQNE